MKRKLGLVLVILVALGVFGVTVVLPAVDREMMRAPVVNGLNAARSGQFRSLQACFTPDATVGYGNMALPAALVLRTAAPYLRSGEGRPASMRVGSFTNLMWLGRDEVEADATIIAYLEGGDLPYRRVPIKKFIQVRLRRVGFLTWRIAHITSDEPEFEQAITGMGMPR